MFQRILVPLDGSERAERAISAAAHLAKASGGSITLLRVVASPIDFTSQTAESPMPVQEAPSVKQARAADYLERIAASDILSGVTTTTEVCQGMPAQAILSTARSVHADIIIMCSRGYTGMMRLMLGSVAEKVAFHAPIPVLILRDPNSLSTGTSPDAANQLRALVALDGSTLSEEAINTAANLVAGLADSAQGALHLLQVITAESVSSQTKELGKSEEVLKAERYLSSTADRLREGQVAPAVLDLKLPVTWSVVLGEDVASALVKVAESGEEAGEAGKSGGFDIIVMATHGFGGVQRWVMGSVTEHVLKGTRLPVLIVRPLDILERSNFTWDSAILFAI
jgi:nucleotide-binding universal stress UspA family protein